MRLYLVRHGDANPEHGTWNSDDERPLSDKGRAEARRVAEAIRVLGGSPDLVLSSPLTRARQTADEICSVLEGDLVPDVTDALAPGADASSILGEIMRFHPDAREIVCTGHMPDLGYAGSQLGAGTGAVPFRLKTGSLVRVDVEDHDAQLTWFLSPRVVKQLVSPR